MLCIKENNQLALDRKQVIKRKVMAIGKISRVYNVLKENPELINQLKTLSFNGKIPAGILTKGEQGIKEAIIVYKKHKLSPNILKEQRDHPITLYNCPTPNYKITTTGSREGHI